MISPPHSPCTEVRCHFQGSRGQFIEHITSYHFWPLIHVALGETITISVDSGPNSLTFIECNNSLFVVYATHINPMLAVTVRYIPTEDSIYPASCYYQVVRCNHVPLNSSFVGKMPTTTVSNVLPCSLSDDGILPPDVFFLGVPPALQDTYTGEATVKVTIDRVDTIVIN